MGRIVRKMGTRIGMMMLALRGMKDGGVKMATTERDHQEEDFKVVGSKGFISDNGEYKAEQ